MNFIPCIAILDIVKGKKVKFLEKTSLRQALRPLQLKKESLTAMCAKCAKQARRNDSFLKSIKDQIHEFYPLHHHPRRSEGESSEVPGKNIFASGSATFARSAVKKRIINRNVRKAGAKE